jgi:hypothetical protein
MKIASTQLVGHALLACELDLDIPLEHAQGAVPRQG